MRIKAIGFALLASFLATAAAHARAIRIDSGSWDSSGFTSADSTQSIGFDFDFFGVTASQADISADGQIMLTGGGESAILSPLFDLNQSAGGNTVQYRFAITNANFNQPVVESGFRVEWQVIDSSGSLFNQYQLALFELTGGVFAMEFNYNQITFGDDSSQIGYATSLGDQFDLTMALGLSFAEYMGVGDDEFSNNCAGMPSALACNNYFAETMAFGPNSSVLPDTAGNFFRQIDSNGGDVQGRYLFLTNPPPSEIPIPAALPLFIVGLAGIGAIGRRRTKAA